MDRREQKAFWIWWLSIIGLLFFDVEIAGIVGFITSFGVVLFLAIQVLIKKERSNGNNR